MFLKKRLSNILAVDVAGTYVQYVILFLWYLILSSWGQKVYSFDKKILSLQ